MATSKKPLKLLLVDDSEDDRDLIVMNLRRGGYNPEVCIADTKEGFTEALEEEKLDLIICDYSMPGFDGLTALAILKEHGLDIPFILVSGAIGEELAVKAMKAGANDYLMKDNLQRLVPAIERELKEAKMREKHRQGEIERDRLLTVIQNSLNEIYIFDCETLRYQYLNRAAISNLGFSANELYEMTPIDIIADLQTPAEFNRIIQPLLQGERDKDIYFTKHVRKDGSSYPIEVHLQLIRQHDRSFFTAIGFDLSDREKDARRIKEHKEVAREMAEHSRHKSQFLANMSHELRTPLNSILLLSKLLLRSTDDHLTAQQLKYIDVIQQSGKNLLSLINEVLDLSKIESGEMELSFEPISLKDLVTQMSAVFGPIAEEKNLEFSVSVYENCPAGFISDQLRIEQVVRNLLSNAMKFTEKGRVDLDVYTIKDPDDSAGDKIAFAVKDTGIGIPEEKQTLVFESFRQADGSTQRKFGGTGLGLSICRQLAELLGGSLTLDSREGIGSTFTLTIPLKSASLPERSELTESPSDTSSSISTDSSSDEPDQRGTLLLLSDSDSLLAEFKTVSDRSDITLNTVRSSEEALKAVKRLSPDAIIIDPYAPELSGWSTAKHIQQALNSGPAIWMVTDHSRPMPEVELDGVQGTLTLPISEDELRDIINSSTRDTSDSAEKTLLLIDDNDIHNEALSEFAEMVVDRCLIATSAKTAYETLEEHRVDCIVLDLTLPDASGKDVLQKIKGTPEWKNTPVIIYSGRSLSPKQKNELLTTADGLIMKNIGSHSKLMKRISELIDHQDNPPVGTQDLMSSAGDGAHNTVLVVDDDDQSYFSISSLLQSNGHRVRRAVSGKAALQILKMHQKEIGLVLLDLMMPDMDGYQTIQKIRQDKHLKSLPVFIVTAKAMKGDREECLRHGATDYISKPVSPEKLEKLMSIWMP